jgi:putative PIN family toxin of toxin-antitoxin system
VIVALYDTNVLISGIFWRGLPRQLVRLARARQVHVVTCQALLDELQSVLTRDDKPFRLSQEEASSIVGDVLTYAHLIAPASQVNVCRDSSDDLVLACALDGQVEYIVTGDPDLLVLKNFESLRIVTPREFISISGFVNQVG